MSVQLDVYYAETHTGYTDTDQYKYFSDGTEIWRKGVRDTYFVLDKALTILGFNGAEDTDWENVVKIT